MAMEEEIKAEFRKSGFDFDDEEEVLSKCKLVSLYIAKILPSAQKINEALSIFALFFFAGLPFCINYSLKPSDLVSSWEVYYLNRFISRHSYYSAGSM